jgi:hypothetical protein
MQPDGCCVSKSRMYFDHSFYESYDITDLKFISKFRLKFRFYFIIDP